MPLGNAAVSIDIGSHSVKVAQLSGGRGGVRAIRFAEQPLPPGFRWEPGTDRRPLVEAIRMAMAKAGIRRRSAVLALPRRQVTARISAYPPADRAALRRVVEYDLSEHIPFPVEQVVLDFQSLGPSREQPGLTDVLVVAAQRDLVRQYLELARDLRVRVAALTVDALALHDLLRLMPEGPPGITLIVEIGARATTINIAEGRRLRLTRSVGLGGQQLTLAVRDDFGVSPEQAQELKIGQGLALLAREPRPHRAAAWLENLRGEMRRSALSFGPAAISRLFLVGAAARVPGLAEAIHSDFGVEPARLSVAVLFRGARLVGGDPPAADGCLLAIAQALRGLGQSQWTTSLVPPEVAQLRRARRLRRAGIAAAVAVAAALVGSYVTQGRALVDQRAAVQLLQRREQQAEKIQAAMKKLVSERDRLRKDLEVLKLPRLRRYASLELLKLISESAPPGVLLTHFTWRPAQSLVIQGTAPTLEAIADLQAGLARSRLVTQVALDRSDQTTLASARGLGAGGPEVVAFSITVHLWTERQVASRAGGLAPTGISQ